MSVTLDEAARVLGISRNAVQQRIKRGTVSAWKTNTGEWLVDLAESDRPTDQPTNHDRPTNGAPDEAIPLLSMAAQQQAVAGVITTAIEAAVTPLLAELGQVRRELGDAREELGRVKAELAAAQERAIAAVPETYEVVPGDTTIMTTATDAPKSGVLAQLRQWWRAR